MGFLADGGKKSLHSLGICLGHDMDYDIVGVAMSREKSWRAIFLVPENRLAQFHSSFFGGKNTILIVFPADSPVIEIAVFLITPE